MHIARKWGSTTVLTPAFWVSWPLVIIGLAVLIIGVAKAATPGLTQGQMLIFGHPAGSSPYPMAQYRLPMPKSCLDQTTLDIAATEYLTYYGPPPVPAMTLEVNSVSRGLVLCAWFIQPPNGEPPVIMRVMIQVDPTGRYIGMIGGLVPRP